MIISFPTWSAKQMVIIFLARFAVSFPKPRVIFSSIYQMFYSMKADHVEWLAVIIKLGSTRWHEVSTLVTPDFA